MRSAVAMAWQVGTALCMGSLVCFGVRLDLRRERLACMFPSFLDIALVTLGGVVLLGAILLGR